MGKKGSPAEWTDPGQLTEEQIREIMKPIDEAPAPAIEVEPEPESIIEGEAAQPEQAEMSPAAGQYEHDQMVKAVLQLLRGIYRARYNGQEPDAKYVDRMRVMYENLSDEQLQQTVDVLTNEAESLKEAA